ncbi:MAG: hypothetical protein ACI8TX_003778 [Hyphomicrobiaceae bacterium]
MQIDPSAYRQLDLHAHSFLSDAQLHDVWRADLRGGGPNRTIEDARLCFTPNTVTTANAAVKTLFSIRTVLGRMFGWDTAGDTDRWSEELYSGRLDAEDRERSLVEPGTPDGMFKVVYVFPEESLAEVRNATVHAFSSLAIRPSMTGYHLFWAIYVKAISPWTPTYMRVIDPFRRAMVYPAVISRIETEWSTRFGDSVDSVD